MIVETIAMGAEAVLIREGTVLRKQRNRKGYRRAELDERIRKLRTRAEARLMERAAAGGVHVPRILKMDEKGSMLEMEFLEGARVKEALVGEANAICRKIGEEVGKLHRAAVAHGDLTTSNMIWKDGEVFLIDFGLAKFSRSIEDFAVDLHLLERALTAAHSSSAKECFETVTSEYLKWMPKTVVARLAVIEKRGRYKH